MAQIETWFSQDLQQAVKVHYIEGNVFSADNNGNIIGVNVFDDGEPATLGGTVSASIIRADGATVAATGTLSGNQVYVALPQAAYAVPGVISIVLKLTSGTTVTTLLAVVGNVYQSTTDTVIDPGTIIPSIDTLIADIEAAVASIPADYSSLWTSLAPAYSTSSAYTVGQYVTYDGGLYRCISAIPSGESWTAAHWTAVSLGNDVSDLKSAFKQELTNANALDILPLCPKDTATSNGVTYTWNSDGSCTVTGTASSTNASYNRIWKAADGFPYGMKANGRYRIKYSSEKLYLEMFKNGSTTAFVRTKEDTNFTVPDTTGITIRLRPELGEDFTTPETVHPMIFTEVPTNEELKTHTAFPFGTLDTGTDADNITSDGIWWISPANSYSHLPAGMTAGILISRLPYTTSTNIRFQMAYSNNDKKIYYRYRTTSGWVSDWKNTLDFTLQYGETHTQTSTSRAMSISKAIAQGDRIAVKVTKWTGPTPQAVNFYTTTDGSTWSLKVTVGKIGQWMEFIADQAYTGYRVGIKTESALTEAATLEFIETPYYQSEYITEAIPGAPVVYGKKILLGGASIVAGYGGTGYAMDGDVIIDISDTAEGQAYSTGGLWKRNTSGYCWANLFKTLVEGQYNATVDNNGCAGVSVSFWARHADVLIPDDGYDLFIYTFGSNDRNVVPSTARTNIRSGLKTLLDRCQELGIEMLVVSVPPASQANEESKLTQTWQCNEFIKEACAELNVRYFDLHDELIKYYWNHGAASAGTYISDGLHPDDAMYYVMYFCYCWLLDVSPMTAYQQPPT